MKSLCCQIRCRLWHHSDVVLFLYRTWLLKRQWSWISLDHAVCVCSSASSPRGLGAQAGNGNDRAAVPGKGSQPELSGSHSQSHLVSPGENMRGSHFLSRLAFALSHSFFFCFHRLSCILFCLPLNHLCTFYPSTWSTSKGCEDVSSEGSGVSLVSIFRSQEFRLKTWLRALSVWCYVKKGERWSVT